MNILEVYKKYQIMPLLQEHMLRVAGVAKIICENIAHGQRTELTQSRNQAKEIVTACLLHDMGNIIKFDLSVSESLSNKKLDIAFWQAVKEGFIRKYGSDEHHGTMAIAKELGVGARELALINGIGFTKGIKTANSNDLPRKICQYADMRVVPVSVVSLEERLLDLRNRYEAKRIQVGGSEETRLAYENAMRYIEKQIFEKRSIKPSDITEETVKKEIEVLKKTEI